MRSIWRRCCLGRFRSSGLRRGDPYPLGGVSNPQKSLEDFNLDHQAALNRDMIAHLGTGAFLAKSRNVVLLGPARHRQVPPGQGVGRQGRPDRAPHRVRHRGWTGSPD
jgi:hypothetical protein